MSFGRNMAVLAAGLTSLLPGERPRRRWAAAVLALGLGLNGVGQCLCAPQPDAACEPQGCCPRSGSHHHGAPGTQPSVQASSTACCVSQTTAAAVAIKVDDRDGVRHASAAVTATHLAADAPATPASVSAAARRSPSSSPPRTTVLRI